MLTEGYKQLEKTYDYDWKSHRLRLAFTQIERLYKNSIGRRKEILRDVMEIFAYYMDMKPWDGSPDNIGKNVRMARKQDKVTQAELAGVLGFSRHGSISLIERGITPISAENLWRIAQMTNYPVEVFYLDGYIESYPQ